MHTPTPSAAHVSAISLSSLRWLYAREEEAAGSGEHGSELVEGACARGAQPLAAPQEALLLRHVLALPDHRPLLPSHLPRPASLSVRARLVKAEERGGTWEGKKEEDNEGAGRRGSADRLERSVLLVERLELRVLVHHVQQHRRQRPLHPMCAELLLHLVAP
eukprot:2784251-Rhodomonas_salina.1